MRERGDLAGFTGAGKDGATATDSVAACICPGLRRQYAIGSLPRLRGLEWGPRQKNNCLAPSRTKPVRLLGHENARFLASGRSLTPNRPSPDQIRATRRGI